ncbi:apicomplexan-conserved protein [Cryptosporidium ryanae]|uniref:apicomplexan-conserved protein n=1 Tax=Cryptosporidium ryanae TaxID=515981 RepID=UPI00351A5E98|nr:apicomplexan-conserved protein [Cryptosporidium ryanae]
MLNHNEVFNLLKRRNRVEGLLGWEKTLIIVDWDDTLIPTTWMTNNKTFDLKNQQLGKIVALFFQEATKLGEVVIITNADPSWVYEISERYLPEILFYLKKIPICSARQFATKNPHDMVNWKFRAFYNVIQCFCDKEEGLKKIISIGDSYWDRDAVFNVYEKNKKIEIVPKAVKFINSPTCEALCEQIIILISCLEEIVICDGAKIYEMKTKLQV